jgi:hypothetical protein
MKKIDELRGPSCLTMARDDEPLFVLRANDEAAPVAVLAWAEAYKNRKMKDQGDLNTRQRAKLKEAFACAAQMMIWKVDQQVAKL